jgi:hypothetical protein
MWGGGSELARLAEGGRFDLACRIERNDWNGTSSVQLTARSVTPVRDAPALALPDVRGEVSASPRERVVHDRRGRGAYGELARLAASGEGLLVVCADATRRSGMLANTLHPARFGLTGAFVLDERTSPSERERLVGIAAAAPCIALTDHASAPAVAAAFARVAVLDPPVSAADVAAFASLVGDVHLVWGDDEQEVARRDHAAREPRALCAAVWRALADGPVEEADLPGLRPGDAAFAVSVLREAGLVVAVEGGLARVENPPRIDLSSVQSFRERAVAHATTTGDADGRGDRPHRVRVGGR